MNQSVDKKRPIDKAANIAVAVVLVLSVINLIGALSKVGGATSTGVSGLGAVVSGVMFCIILACYAIVIARAPGKGRWAYFVLLGGLFAFAYASALSGGTTDQHAMSNGAASAGLVVVTGLICLPLVYMRLRTPKKAAVEA
jgi:hypothetical protein